MPTPISIEDVEQAVISVNRLQSQIDTLIEALDRITERVDALETKRTKRPRPTPP